MIIWSSLKLFPHIHGCLSIYFFLNDQFSAKFGQFSAKFRPCSGYVSAKFQPSFCHVSAMFRPCFGQVMAKFRLGSSEKLSTIASFRNCKIKHLPPRLNVETSNYRKVIMQGKLIAVA